MDRLQLPDLGENLGFHFYLAIDSSVRNRFEVTLPHTVRESLILRLAPSLRDSFLQGLREALR